MISPLERHAALGGNLRTMEQRIGARYGDAALPWAGGLPGGGEPGDLYRQAVQRLDPGQTLQGILEAQLGPGDLTGEPARKLITNLTGLLGDASVDFNANPNALPAALWSGTALLAQHDVGNLRVGPGLEEMTSDDEGGMPEDALAQAAGEDGLPDGVEDTGVLLAENGAGGTFTDGGMVAANARGGVGKKPQSSPPAKGKIAVESPAELAEKAGQGDTAALENLVKQAGSGNAAALEALRLESGKNAPGAKQPQKDYQGAIESLRQKALSGKPEAMKALKAMTAELDAKDSPLSEVLRLQCKKAAIFGPIWHDFCQLPKGEKDPQTLRGKLNIALHADKTLTDAQKAALRDEVEQTHIQPNLWDGKSLRYDSRAARDRTYENSRDSFRSYLQANDMTDEQTIDAVDKRMERHLYAYGDKNGGTDSPDDLKTSDLTKYKERTRLMGEAAGIQADKLANTPEGLEKLAAF